MKHALKFICLFLLGIALQNCAEEENADSLKEKVQFTFDLSSLDATGGRVGSSDIPTGTSLLVSIEKSSGESVLSFHEVELLHVGGGLITIPLELTPGSYKLTDFILVNEDDEILFATPRRGSPLARLVIRPLDVIFSVARDRLTNIQMEVVDVSQNEPEDFGYVSFSINIVHPLQLSVFVPNTSGLKLASAKAYILQGNDTLQQFNLGARINLIAFKQEIDEPYTLLISKNGYAPYRREFIYTDLIAELAGLPLKVILTPAFTLLAYVNTTDADLFAIDLEGLAGGNIDVNWGDGDTDNYTFGAGTSYLEHSYAATGNYYVSITGDLTSITYFYSFYGNGMIDEINLEQLTELKEIRLGLTRSPRVVDLSHNTKLESVFMPNAANTEIIDLPASNNIDFVLVSGPNPLTVASLSAMIDDVYLSAVADGRLNGGFEFTETWYPDYGGMVVTPTPAALAKLVALRDTYGWTITPNP